MLSWCAAFVLRHHGVEPFNLNVRLGGLLTLASRRSMPATIDESGSVETNAIARVPFERQIDLVHRQGSSGTQSFRNFI